MLTLSEWSNHVFFGNADGVHYSNDIHIDNVVIENINIYTCENRCLDYSKLTALQILDVSYTLYEQLIKICLEHKKLDSFMPLLRIEMTSSENLSRYSPLFIKNDFDPFIPPSLFLYDRDWLRVGLVRKGLILTESIDIEQLSHKLKYDGIHSYFETYYDSKETDHPYRREIIIEYRFPKYHLP